MRIRSFCALLGVVSALLVLVTFRASRTSLAADEPAAATKPHVQKIDVNEFDQKRKDADAVVLDVRTPREYAAGHVPGAVNIDVHDPKFSEKVEGLDRSKTYLVHCAKGVRSEAASNKMAAIGFTHLFDFHGGFSAWENAHKPIEKGSGAGQGAER